MKSVKEFVVKLLLIVAMLAVVMSLFHGARFFLLVLAGALIAIMWRGVARWIAEKTGARFKVILPIVIFANISFLVVFFILASPSISEQISRIAAELPNALRQLEANVRATMVGSKVMESFDENGLGEEQAKQVFNIFSGTLNFVVDILLIFAFAIFLCFDPKLYQRGVLHLIPRKYHSSIQELFERLNHTLFRWFIGMFIDMSCIFIMILIGLWLLDMPMIFTFALIAFLFSFVPNIGPVVSAIPPMAIALLESPQKALYVGLLYLGVQLFESYFITPNVQKRASYLPPVLLLLIQFIMAKFLGVLGLFLSTPLLVILIVTINKLYVQDYLGNNLETVKQSDLDTKST